MAVDKFLEIYDEQGNPVDYDIRANDVKFPDGESLPDKLAEIESDVEAAGQVNDIKVGNDTYTPTNKTIDLSAPFAAKQDAINDLADIRAGAAAGATALQPGDDVPATDVTGLAPVATSGSYNDLSNKPTIPTKTSELENDSGFVTEAVQSVTVETNEDGTVDFNVDDDTYKVNLNHTHPNMAKLVVCEESDLPSTLAKDTIYAQVDDADNPTEIEVLYIAGVEFVGGAPAGTPTITKPSGTSINLGHNAGSGVSKQIEVRGRNLSADITLAVSTGLTLSYGQSTGQSSITIPVADALTGALVTVAYASAGELDDGALAISGGGLSAPKNYDVIVEAYYIELAGVKFTGAQWLQTDYKPNPNTEFELDFKFAQNANSLTQDYGNIALICCDNNTGDTGSFKIYNGYPSSYSLYGSGNLFFLNDSGQSVEVKGVKPTSGKPTAYADDLFTDHSKLRYVKGVSEYTCSRNSSTKTLALKTTTMENALKIGYGTISNTTGIYGLFDVTIYEFTITENGNTVRHWVPKSKNGVPGLYDTVNGTFISSETSTELVAIALT